jgi:hypothetical protein
MPVSYDIGMIRTWRFRLLAGSERGVRFNCSGEDGRITGRLSLSLPQHRIKRGGANDTPWLASFLGAVANAR